MYHFSQQGWKNFNHMFSTVYFRWTNHGCKRHAGIVKSKLLGIGQWLQRRLLWMTGIADQVLREPNNTNLIIYDNGGDMDDDA